MCRENFFQDVGEVIDVRFSVDYDGRFKGFGHVEFSTAEAAKKVITDFILWRCYFPLLLEVWLVLTALPP